MKIIADTSATDRLFLAILFLLALLVFYPYIFFEKVYLFRDIGSDSINIFYPAVHHLSEYLRTDGIPKWSFNQGLGQNIFPFSLGDPFTDLLLIPDKSYIPYLIVYVEMLKIILAGWFFYIYLQMMAISRFVAVIVALSYAFSGYIILGSGWAVFSTEVVYAAFLLYAFECLLVKKRIYLFPLAFAMTGLWQPFHLYLFSLFIFFYSLLRCFDGFAWSCKQWLLFMSKAAVLASLGVLMSAVALLPNTLQMLESPRGESLFFLHAIRKSGNVFAFVDVNQIITVIGRLFSTDILESGSFFKGWHNYLEAPVLYCGLFNLLVAPLFFINNWKRRLRFHYILVAFFLIMVFVPFFRYAFWLFSGNYYRTLSLFLIIYCLYLSAHALNNNDLKRRSVLIVSGGIFLVFLLFIYLARVSTGFDNQIALVVAIFLSMYALLLILMGDKKYLKFGKCALLILIAIELSLFSFLTVNKRDVMNRGDLIARIGFNDYTKEAMSYLYADRSFYRINKEYPSGLAVHKSLNDAKIQGFMGSASYAQFNQINYVKFLVALGVIDPKKEHETRWLQGLTGRPLLQWLVSTKYHLTKSPEPDLGRLGYQFLGLFKDVYLFRNSHFIPFGFTYNNFISFWEFSKLSSQEKDVGLLNAMVTEEPTAVRYREMNRIGKVEVSRFINNLDRSIGELKKNVLVVESFGQNRIAGNISLDGKKMLFLSIPFDRGWQAKVDGRVHPLEKINVGFMGLLLDKGEHSVLLEYNPPLLKLGMWLSMIGIALYIFLILKLKSRKSGLDFV